MMKPRDVTIKTKLGGWLVKVGCTEIVFADKELMFNALKLYLEDPEETETNYLGNAVNHKFFPSEERELAVREEPQMEEGGCRQAE